MRKRIFGNRGMTYVELMVALTLLTLIIISFTPMLLSSYEALYQAGEDVESVYDSQREVEEGLANRYPDTETEINMTLKVNSTAFFETLKVKGYKMVSSMQDALETVFGQSRARIDIISGNVVYDDSPNQEIIIQTTGLIYKHVIFDKNRTLNGGNVVDRETINIIPYLPDKITGTGEASTDETVYSNGDYVATIRDYDNPATIIDRIETDSKKDNGIIKFQISGPKTPKELELDFTRSPVKILIKYIDNRGKNREVFAYLHIKPATIMMAGESKNKDYYTSEGIFKEDNSSVDASGKPTQSEIFTFDVAGRTMRTDNSTLIDAAGVKGPKESGNRINVVKWIDNDETAGIEPYYILAGSNGRIYRMYNFRNADAKSAPYTDVQVAKEKIYDTDEGYKIFPALWSGDRTHIFEYSTAWRFLAYGQTYDSRWTDLLDTFSKKSDRMDHCWITSDGTAAKGDPKYNKFSPTAQFCYYSNPSAAPYEYSLKKMRPISYVLTEKGFPIRLFGVMESVGQNQNGSTDKKGNVYDENGNLLPYGTPGYGKFTEYDGFYKTWDSNRDNYFFEDASTDINHWYNNPNRILAFIYGKKIPGTQNKCVMGPIRILSLASYKYSSSLPDQDRTNYLTDACDDFSDVVNKDNTIKYMAKIKDVRQEIFNEGYHVFGKNFYPVKDCLGGQADEVNITDVIYIPSTDTKAGGKTDPMTFYIGTVHGFARLQQTDRINTNVGIGEVSGPLVWKDYWSEDNYSAGGGKAYRHSVHKYAADRDRTVYPCGALTDFIVMSNNECNGTYISKFACGKSQADGSVSQNGKGWEGTEFAKDTITQAFANNVAEMDKDVLSRKPGATDEEQNEFFFPSRGTGNENVWKTILLDDVAFTFGFASNRERVYSDITYHGTNAEDGVEYNRSYERLYLLSHYGKYENQPKRAMSKPTYGANVADVESVVKPDEAYLNNYNNDYYNVWLPGEMYNLTKTATKEGVTVAVGYAVAGSSYQYVHNDPTWQYGITSTALGSIYNDGVMSCMVEGQDAAFKNLLYFKDNETFDDDSITNRSDFTTKYPQYQQYKDANGYGMHGRRSEQFTAVDLFVENLSPTAGAAGEGSVTGDVRYYAIYGDNQGRVFKSLVARGTATQSGDPDAGTGETITSDIEKVDFIADTTFQMEGHPEKLVNAGTMDEITTVNDESLSKYFSKIQTISASDDLIVITGKPKNGTKSGYVVIGVPQEDAEGYPITDVDGSYIFEYKPIKVLTNGMINASTIVEGYYYAVGEFPTGDSRGSGFAAGVSLDYLKVAAQNNIDLTTRIITSGSSPEGNHVFVKYVNDKLYAISGHETE